MKKIICMFLAAVILAISMSIFAYANFPVLTIEQSNPGLWAAQRMGDMLSTMERNREIAIYNQYQERIMQEELNNARLRNEIYRRALQNRSKHISTKKSKQYYAQIKRNNVYKKGVHYVRPYVKKNGTYVRGHLAGNPGSGIHCHNNVCY